MTYRSILNIIILIILFILNIIINNHKYYFLLIYSSLLLYNLIIIYSVIKNGLMNRKEILWFLLASLFSYFFSYYIIYDPNPIICIFTYYIFFPDFYKAILIIILHTYFYTRYSNLKEYNYINNLDNKKSKKNFCFNNRNEYYFLSDFIKYFKMNKKRFFMLLISLLLFYSINAILFVNRIRIWIYFYNKEKTLPVASSKNTTFYITAMVVNMEGIIVNYIEEMKKLIYYLGKENVIISIVENGDSKDKTRDYLRDFKTYLDNNNITNKFILTREIEDIRNKTHLSNNIHLLKIIYYSILRNKCFDLMYEIPNLKFNNTKIIYFNDIYYKYEDIINLISTNNEDYDAVCASDFNEFFYDRWVSIDLDGNSLLKIFHLLLIKKLKI